MPKANSSHDISFIEPTDSTEIGLMLAHKDGVPMWSEYDDPALAQQFFSGDPSYGNLPPEKEVQIAQSDWRAGIAQEIYNSADPKRYWKSIHMDLRDKDTAIAGAASGISTLGTTGVMRAWAEFEDDLYVGVNDRLHRLSGTGYWGEVMRFTDKNITDMVEFIDGNLYIALGAANKYYYMPAELVIEDCEATWDELTEADVTAGVSNTIYMNGLKSATFEVKAGLEAGDLIATHDMTSVDLTGYTEISFWIRSNLDLDANDMQLLLSAEEECANPTEELNIPALTKDEWKSVHLNLADPTDLGAIISIGLKMVVDGVDNIYIDDVRVGDYTESAHADGKANFFTMVNDTLWKGIKPNELASTSSPETDGWSAVTKVGSTAQDITDLVAESGQLYIMKEDMPYYLDTEGNVHRLIPSLKPSEASTSGANSLAWKGKLYMPYGAQELVEYADGVATYRTPADFCENASEYAGRVTALASDERYLYAFVYGDTYQQILAGRLEAIDSAERWVWHPVARDSQCGGNGCGLAFVASVWKKKLWFGGAGTGHVQYMDLPDKYAAIVGSADYNFYNTTASCYFITPYHHANFKADDKAFIKLTLDIEDADSGDYFTAYYRLRPTSAWTEIGTYTTPPTQTRYIPADSNSVNPTGKMIQFKFTCATGSTTTTPKLKGYDCRAIWYPTKRWLIGCSVKCADNLVIKDQSTDTQTADQIDTAITDAVETDWPMLFYPPEYGESGDEFYGKILRAEKVMTKNISGQNPEYQYNLLLAKTPLA